MYLKFFRVITLLAITLLLAPAGNVQAQTFSETSSQLTLVNAFPNLTFEQPLLLTHAGDGSNRVFVVEKTGAVHTIVNDPQVTTTKTFLDISDKILPRSDSNVGETGLLSLAFHPDHANNGKVYLSYVDENLMSILSEMTISSDPDVADQGTERILLQMQQPQRNHNAGHIAFGLDGYLYISFGDGFSESSRDGITSGDPLGHGQNLSTWFSSVLRIDVDNQDADKAYAIPDDNPFVGNTEGWLEEIYAYGFRNPWRFSIDRETGDLWLGDVGDKKAEEIDLVESGKNYGWALKEATHCFEDVPCDTTQWVNLQDPIFEYLRDVGESITGGYVYRGNLLNGRQGHYFYGDFDFGHIWALEYSDGEVQNNELIETVPDAISSFGEDEAGELYVVGFIGTIRRLESQSATGSESPEGIPEEFNLHPNYPNPFNPITRFSFDVPEAGHLKIEIRNVLGQSIKILEDRYFNAGRFEAAWDGRDKTDELVASGVYFYTIESASYSKTRTMLFLK